MIKNLLSADQPEPEESKRSAPRSPDGVLGLFDDTPDREGDSVRKEDYVISQTESQPMEETVRQTGLAWSAGIAFFAAVVFMLILGWGADVLLGTSPWGMVGGIVLGSIIGFIQFFRITSQIFKK